MITYNDLVALEGPVRYEHSGRGHLKMVNHTFPWSLTEPEFQYLYNLIIERKYTCGFEVATAFGISSLAAALAFKETGGRIVTMDAYIEEAMNDPMAYKSIDPSVYDDSDGFKSVKFLVEHFELQKPYFLSSVGVQSMYLMLYVVILLIMHSLMQDISKSPSVVISLQLQNS